MAIVFDAGATGAYTAGSNAVSITWNHTCTGSDGYLIVAVCCTTSNSTLQATYHSVAMTLIDSYHDSGSWSNWVYLFGLVAPDTGSAYAVLVSTIDTSSVGMAGVSASYTGVHQTTPYGTPSHWANGSTGFTSPWSESISSGITELVISAISGNYGDENWAATGTGQTIRESIINGSIGTGAGAILLSDLPGAATATATYTFSTHGTEYPSETMVGLKPSAGGVTVAQYLPPVVAQDAVSSIVGINHWWT